MLKLFKKEQKKEEVDMKKNICFVLPDGAYNPTGGAKVVFEYAKRFADAGYSVTIGYCIPHKNIRRGKIYNALKSLYYILKYKIFREFSPKKWYQLQKSIHHIVLPLSPLYTKHIFKKTDYICATALETSFYVAAIPNISNTNKLYLIQGFEAWGGVTEDEVFASYKLPLKKICIAPWLLEKVKSVGEEAILIPNGFDFDYFTLTEKIESRNPYSICLLNHNDDTIKRVSDSISALKKVKQMCPELTVNMFGIPERPKELPDWFHYYQKPDKQTHNKIYNESAIFIAASSTEGMALPPAEAMICGCALICTNIGGFALYAKNSVSALTFDVGDIDAYANLILFLITHNDARIELAKTGNKLIHQFTWEQAFFKFTSFLNEVVQ